MKNWTREVIITVQDTVKDKDRALKRYLYEDNERARSQVININQISLKNHEKHEEITNG